jgi:hypothetical protein
LFFRIVLNAWLRRGCAGRLAGLELLPIARKRAVAIFSGFPNIAFIALGSVGVFALYDLWFHGWHRYCIWVETGSFGPLVLLRLFDELRSLAFRHDAVLWRTSRPLSLFHNLADQRGRKVVMTGHLFGDESFNFTAGLEFALKRLTQ